MGVVPSTHEISMPSCEHLLWWWYGWSCDRQGRTVWLHELWWDHQNQIWTWALTSESVPKKTTIPKANQGLPLKWLEGTLHLSLRLVLMETRLPKQWVIDLVPSHDKEMTRSPYQALIFQLGDLTIACSISSPLACVDHHAVVSNTFFSEARSCHIRSRRSCLRCNPYTWLSGMIAESLGGAFRPLW